MMTQWDEPSSSCKKPAASFVDVVATGTCVALLACLFLPALGNVRKVGKADRCLNNLAQIAMATAIYTAQDSNSMALPVHRRQFDQCPEQAEGGVCTDAEYVGAYEWGGKSGTGRPHPPPGSNPEPFFSDYGTWKGFGPATRPLNKILYGDIFSDAWKGGVLDREQALADTRLDLSVYECPSDTGVKELHCPTLIESGASSYDHFGTSYNANLYMVEGRYLGSGFEAGEMGSNSPYLHGAADVPNPARTLAYQENNGRWAWAAYPEIPQCAWRGLGPYGTPRAWHGKPWTFNAAFIDGHVDTIYMRGRTNKLYPSDEDTSNNCNIVRGEGWQIDTFPAPLARTRLIPSDGGRPSYENCIWGDGSKAIANGTGNVEGSTP